MAEATKVVTDVRNTFWRATGETSSTVAPGTVDGYISDALREINMNLSPSSRFSVTGSYTDASNDTTTFSPALPDDEHFFLCASLTILNHLRPKWLAAADASLNTNTPVGHIDATSRAPRLESVVSYWANVARDAVAAIRARKQSLVPRGVNLATANLHKRFYSQEPNYARRREFEINVLNPYETNNYIWADSGKRAKDYLP